LVQDKTIQPFYKRIRNATVAEAIGIIRETNFRRRSD
jgi:hypothetical protein